MFTLPTTQILVGAPDITSTGGPPPITLILLVAAVIVIVVAGSVASSGPTASREAFAGLGSLFASVRRVAMASGLLLMLLALVLVM